MQPTAFGIGAGGQQQPEPDSLFAQQPFVGDDGKPWWQRNFLLQQPTLVNAWNAVFPTVIVNIFGIVIFLRMGWIVGTAGLLQAILVLFLCTLFSSVTVLSAIGICERCQIQSGGIYFLVSHVLGKRIGGAVGLIYTFGQACATSLVALGFGEFLAKMLVISNAAVMKGVSIVVLILLNTLNLAGLRFIIRLQLLLLCFLGLAIGDFLVGALFLTPKSADEGIGQLSGKRLSLNWISHYAPANCTREIPQSVAAAEMGDEGSGVEPIPSVGGHSENFFSVFGVLFANFIGVLAGVNMSGNLADPMRNIAEGELSALGVSFALIFVFMLILGTTVDRYALLCDVMISEKLSFTKLLFLGGLYISCLAAILSSTLGTSRVVQGIAQEGLFPQMSKLLHQDNPGQDPQRATMLVTSVAILLLLLGDLNQLAILSSLPFLFTYAMVNYAYVSLAMSHDLDTLAQQCNGQQQQSTGGGGASNYGTLQDGQKQQQSLSALFSATVEDGTRAGGSSNNGIGGTSSEFAGGAGWNEDVAGKPWYHQCINRYVSFAAAIVHLLMFVLVHRWFALLHLLAFVAIYLYLGKTCPAASDQGISHFSIVHMIRVAMSKEGDSSWTPAASTSAFLTNSTASGSQQQQQRTVLSPPGLIQPGDIQPQPMNAENPDYAQRKQYHHAEQLGR